MVKLKRPLFAAVTVVPVMISDDADARSENVMVVEAGMFELVQVMEREEPATQVDPPTLTVIEYVPPPGPPGSVGPPPPPPAFNFGSEVDLQTPFEHFENGASLHMIVSGNKMGRRLSEFVANPKRKRNGVGPPCPKKSWLSDKSSRVIKVRSNNNKYKNKELV